MPVSVHWQLARAIQGAVPTRQTSSSGRAKSPRIQVVLPEDLCARLAALADVESRTVSNMAKVLIQQGVERLERQLGVAPSPAAPMQEVARKPISAQEGLPHAASENAVAPAGAAAGADLPVQTGPPAALDPISTEARTEALRQSLEHQEVARPQRRGPRRLRLQRPVV